MANEPTTNTNTEIPAGRTVSTPDAAALAARESRRQEITRDPAFWTDGPTSKALRDEVAALAAALQDAPLEEDRSAFGLTVPDERVLPKAWREQYHEDYSGWESDFLLAAREHGLEASLVRDLRDAGIRLAIEAEGRPVTNEAWAAMEQRFKGRLSPSQFASLRRWWKTSVERVEGGGGA